MLALETLVAIGAALFVAALVAARVRLPLALVQVLAGVLLGFIPAFLEVELPSEAVLLLFLPALLFWESLTTSRQTMRRYIRVVLLNGTLLVVVSAFAAAYVATLFGVPWAVALVVGAALAPTDATAVGSLAHGLPRRQRTVLRAESLINDGTALVLYAIAVGVAVGSVTVTPLSIAWSLAVSYFGGILIGVAVGVLSVYLQRIAPPLPSNVALVVTPFLAFLVAELIDASGVLAVVVCGLVFVTRAPRAGAPQARDDARSFWTVATYILNGALFVLIGLELQVLVRGLSGGELWIGLSLGAVLWIVLILARVAFVYLSTAVIRTLDRRPYQRTLRAPARGLVVGSFAGFRGAVSLAAVLAIPTTVADGSAFPLRDLVVFATAVAIVLTLAVQGPLFAPLVRWARLPVDATEAAEETLARREASRAALAALPDLAASLEVEDTVREKAEREIHKHLRVLQAEGSVAEAEVAGHVDQYRRLRLAALGVKRDTVLRLRDERRIDDAVMQAVQAELDLEELRLTGRAVEE